MSKAGRPKKKSDLFFDLEGLKEAVKNVPVTASDAGHVPSIIEFIESDKYLGLPHRKPTSIDLYPFQRIMLKAFYAGSIGNQNIGLSEEELALCKENNFEDEDTSDIFIKKDNGITKSELVLVWGRRSGKDFIVSILACYEAAKLLESPEGDPYKLYNLGSGAPFTILTVANSSAQAQVLFNEIKDKIINSPYFADKIVASGILADQIHLLTPADKVKNVELAARGLPTSPGSVIIRCGHSNSDSLAGISCYCLLLDEIGLYKQTAGSSGGESIYRTLAPATATYVRKEKTIDPYGNEKLQDVYDGKIICISSPRGKEGVFYELYRKSSSVSHRVMCKLPTWKVNPNQTVELLREKFANMTEEEFMMEFGAEFSGTAGQTFFTRDMVERSFGSSIKLRDHGEGGFSYFCHLDPATSSHNYALCVCHREMFINPQTNKTDFKIKVDHLKYWQPKEGKPILTEEVDNYIIALSKRFNFELVTFDQWNSQHSIDHLKKHSVPAKMTRFTKRYKIIIYDNLYDLCSAGRLEIPDHDLLKNEMLYLQRRYTPTGYRVFAKKDGLVKTDDLVDALAGAAYACMHDSVVRLPQGRLVSLSVNPVGEGVVFRSMSGVPIGHSLQQQKWSKRF